MSQVIEIVLEDGCAHGYGEKLTAEISKGDITRLEREMFNLYFICIYIYQSSYFWSQFWFSQINF